MSSVTSSSLGKEECRRVLFRPWCCLQRSTRVSHLPVSIYCMASFMEDLTHVARNLSFPSEMCNITLPILFNIFQWHFCFSFEPSFRAFAMISRHTLAFKRYKTLKWGGWLLDIQVNNQPNIFFGPNQSFSIQLASAFIFSINWNIWRGVNRESQWRTWLLNLSYWRAFSTSESVILCSCGRQTTRSELEDEAHESGRISCWYKS